MFDWLTACPSPNPSSLSPSPFASAPPSIDHPDTARFRKDDTPHRHLCDDSCLDIHRHHFLHLITFYFSDEDIDGDRMNEDAAHVSVNVQRSGNSAKMLERTRFA